METKDLIRLRKLLNKDIKKINRIEELQKNKDILEYLELTGIKKFIDEEIDIREYSLRQILENFKIEQTNGIYVCTRAFYTTYNITYEETNTYSVDTDIDSKHATFKIYEDIESKKTIPATREKSMYYQNTIEDFENENIVLNPCNTCKNANDFEEVRYEFFDRCLRNGQEKGKKLILEKYTRL